MTEDQKLANELSMKAAQLRDSSRNHWKNANESLKAMGSDITEMHKIHAELAVVLKRIAK